MSHPLFVAIRNGEYTADLVGVFSTLEAAIDAATGAVLAAQGHYHEVEIEIIECEPDSAVWPAAEGTVVATVDWSRPYPPGRPGEIRVRKRGPLNT